MKQINFLKKTLLAVALLLGGTSSVWAASYIPSTVKTIATTGNYVFSDLEQGVTDGWVIYAGGTNGALAETTNKAVGITDSDFGFTDANKNTNVSTVQVKTDGGVFNSNKRVVHMLVTNITGVKAIGSAQSGRGFQIGATEYTNSTTESTSMTIVAGNSSATNPVSYHSLDPSKTYIISIFGYNGDVFLYGVRFTADERSGAPISWPVSNYAATIGGSNTFPTLTNEGGLTVTYSSSKTGVATINETTGAISLVAQGTTTITATYTASGPSDTYRTTKVSYELSVSNLAVQSNKFWNFSSDDAWSGVGEIASTTIIDNMEILADGSNKQTLSTSGAVDFNGLSLTKFFSPGNVKDGSRQFHIRVAPKSMITVYINCTSDSRKLKITKDSKTGTAITEQTVGTGGAQIFTCYYTGDIAADLYIYNSGSNGMNIYGVKVQPYITVGTLSGRNYGSYVTNSKLDFGNTDGITAYIATGFNSAKTAIVLTPVDVVPASTPIIVKTDEQGSIVNVPITTADASNVSGNALVAGDGTTAWNGTDGYTYYYLASDLFHQATSGTLQSGKAYLKVLTSDIPTEARSLSFVFDDENTTAIETVKSQNLTNGEFYNLAGQRIAKPTKGMYIVNGKKVVIK